jgi:hypothetical protein
MKVNKLCFHSNVTLNLVLSCKSYNKIMLSKQILVFMFLCTALMTVGFVSALPRPVRTHFFIIDTP